MGFATQKHLNTSMPRENNIWSLLPAEIRIEMLLGNWVGNSVGKCFNVVNVPRFLVLPSPENQMAFLRPC